ncbi:MAG: AMP-binding protein [Terracidiphilus sp.]|jgi:long-chain acyl-CoA synthetase
MRDHLATLLDDFHRYGREVAVVRYQGNRRRVTTYGEIARLAGRFAALLAQRGIEPGDRVLIWAENSAEWIAAFHGCMLRGVLAVPLDAHGTAEFATRVAADVKPKLAVGDAVLLSQLPDNEQKLGFTRILFEEWLEHLPAEEAGPVPGLSGETPLQILFTSGTTGDPKGIVITHGNVLASVGPIEDASQPYLRYERLIHPLRILHTLPLSHVFGQTMGLWVPPIYRAELHFESRLVAPRLIETIRKERISVLAAVPRVHGLLKAHLEATLPGLTERAEGPQGTATGVPVLLRWWRFRDVHWAFGIKFWALISGGGALPGPLEKFWNAVGFVVVQGYGMTETTALITLNHPFHVAQGTIGKPLAGREVKLGPDGEVLVRGAAISKAIWSGGVLKPREDQWLATGDLAEMQPTGELRFLGRKSEVIVTAAGLNLHPEDLEAAIDQSPGVRASAVVQMETAAGPEPCAVLAFHGTAKEVEAAIEHANARLAEFQRLRRWVVWPEPDLPRTSTGKVRRKAVAEWLAKTNTTSNGEANGGLASKAAKNGSGVSTDWLLTLIEQVSGEAPAGAGDDLRLTEDLHLDSLGRVQLAASIEERMGMVPESSFLEEVQTLGALRRLVGGPQSQNGSRQTAESGLSTELNSAGGGIVSDENPEITVSKGTEESTAVRQEPQPEPQAVAAPKANFLYPRWPWWLPMRWVRAAFCETVIRPLTRLLAKPKVVSDAPEKMESGEPLLIVANHVTAFDAALLLYALPGKIRRRVAVAMSGEMLEDFRHFRNPFPGPKYGRFYLFGPPAYWLVTAFYNVFPLPRQRDFQPSFSHAGEAMDRGFSVMVFPEGARSPEGKIARFRPGIGLLVKQSGVPVLPMALRGLGELKTQQLSWFRSGMIEVVVGEPIRFSVLETEANITARLQDEVEKLMRG